MLYSLRGLRGRHLSGRSSVVLHDLAGCDVCRVWCGARGIVSSEFRVPTVALHAAALSLPHLAACQIAAAVCACFRV